MSSMLDDHPEPAAPRYIICPCCTLGFKTFEAFEHHALGKITAISLKLEHERKKRQKPAEGA